MGASWLMSGQDMPGGAGCWEVDGELWAGQAGDQPPTGGCLLSRSEAWGSLNPVAALALAPPGARAGTLALVPPGAPGGCHRRW